MKTVIVTGAAGFLGSHLCEYYLNQNYNVIGLDNFCTGQEKNIHSLKNKSPDRFYFIEMDICSSWDFVENFISQKKIGKIEFIFHFASAASVPHYQKLNLETMAANSTGLKKCLEFSNIYGSRTIFASTSEVYGDPEQTPQAENYNGNVSTTGPRSCYDESKRFGEALLTNWNHRYHTQHGIVRIFNTYGPRMSFDDGRVILRFIQKALTKKPLTIFGNGDQTRSFCYVDDLILGIHSYAKSSLTEPLNLGRADEITMNDLAKLILKLTESRSTIEYGALPLDDPQRRVPHLEKAQNELNYSTSTDLTTGLRKMISWFKNETL
jgi:nucleoside-diphosphate-sugar epimerase